MPLCSGCCKFQEVAAVKRKDRASYSSKGYICRLQSGDGASGSWKLLATQFLSSIGHAILAPASSTSLKQAPHATESEAKSPTTTDEDDDDMPSLERREAIRVSPESSTGCSPLEEGGRQCNSVEATKDSSGLDLPPETKASRFGMSTIQVGATEVKGFPNSHVAITRQEPVAHMARHSEVKDLLGVGSDGHFQSDRVKAKVENFKRKGGINKPLNARQKKRGRTVTSRILGEVPFSVLGTGDIALVKTELRAWGLNEPWLLPKKDGIRNMVAVMKSVALTSEEQRLGKKSFKPLSGGFDSYIVV